MVVHPGMCCRTDFGDSVTRSWGAGGRGEKEKLIEGWARSLFLHARYSTYSVLLLHCITRILTQDSTVQKIKTEPLLEISGKEKEKGHLKKNKNKSG
jgi:hypothetical protein